MRFIRPDSRNQVSGPSYQDTNLIRFHGDAAASAIEDAAVAYQSPSLIAAGADAQHVSLLATLMNLAMAVLCLKAPELIYRAGLTRKGAIQLSSINLCTWVPLALSFFFADVGLAPAWLAFLWFINLAPGLLISVQRDNWVAGMVPVNSLNRYLGQRMAIKSAFYLGSFLLLGHIMDSSTGRFTGFLTISAIAIAAVAVDTIILSFMREEPPLPARNTRPPISFPFPAYLHELKNKKLGKFVSYTTLIFLTVGLSGPIYAVYMLQELHFSYVTYTIIIAAEFVARIVSMPFWGRASDRSGNIRILGIVSRIIPFIPVLWLISPHPGFLIAVQVISGCCWGAFDLNTQSYLLKAAPPEKKLWYIVYSRCLIMLSAALGGCIGAMSIGSILPVMGSSNLSMFLLSAIARVFIVFSMVPKLVDIIHVFGRTARTRRVATYPSPDPSVLRGLYYYRQRDFTADISHRETSSAAAKPAFEIHRISPHLWERIPSTRKTTQGDVQPLKVPHDGLYYRPRPSYRQAAPVADTATPPVDRNTALYYDASRWKKYFRDSLTSLLREDRDTGQRLVPAPVIAY